MSKALKVAVNHTTLAITYEPAKANYAKSYAAVLAFDGFTGAVLKQRSAISTALDIPASARIEGRIAIAVVTSLEAENPLAAATELAVATLKTPEATIRAAHDAYWKGFWNRFNADAGHEFLPVIAARLGQAEWWREAMFRYIQFFQVHDQGLFHYYNIFGNKVLELGSGDGVHPYLEASGIMATGVNEMLLQSYDGTIRVFPAVPERWPARFILRAAGSYLVASEHRGRNGVPYIVIQPVAGKKRTCRVALPWAQGAVLTVNGRKGRLKSGAGKVEFSAKPGSVYVLTPTGRPLNNVPMVNVTFDTQYSPCRLGNVWFGSRDSQMNHTSSFPLW